MTQMSVPKSGLTSSTQREGREMPHPPRQQQSRSQDKVRMQPIHKRLHQTATIGRSLAPDSAKTLQSAGQSAVLTSKTNERMRTERSVKLPPGLSVRNKEASYNQPSPEVKVPEGASRSRSMTVKPPQSPAGRTNIPAVPSQTPSTFQDRQNDRRKRIPRKASPILYVLRLLILGVGIGAIAGTLLSVMDPASRITAERSQTATAQKMQQVEAKNAAVVPASALKLAQEIMPLKVVVQQLVAKNANLMPGVFFVDLDTGGYLDLNGSSTFAAASMIKFPILVAFFQDVDAGKIRLDEKLTLKQELIGGGSGEMQYRTLGTKFTALETATKMIVISDNTATNMLIARMGGATALNQRFQSWGLTVTEIRNLLPDLPGTNTTSPMDLAHLMALVNQGDLISLRSRDRLLDIMRRTKTATLLPRGLGAGATIAHKTGDIGTLVGDVGLVDMPSGKRYIAVAMVKRSHNDSRAQELIRQISRAAYQQFSKPAVNQIVPTTPFVTATPIIGAGEGRR